ncbi:hypothetical protein QYE76_001432 [Lolium multiflorum]|uniref:CCHC-type domain-containing protein n=1 Tax=Lolium multiflorum TaxID=4521 RepID=A0AAD8RMW3_LOLMU|nr:hypothetical protein QYE76_001432 [Lolium multiflorum]
MEYSRLCRGGGDGHLEALTGDNIDLIAAHLDVTYTVRLAACSRELYDQISKDEGKMHHWDEPCLLMPPPAYWFDEPWFVATASRLHVTVYDLVPLDHPRRSVTLPFMHDRKWLGANGDWIAAADHRGCQWCLVNVYTERHIPLPSPPDPKIGHGVTYQPATKDWLYYLCWSRAINLLKIVICQVPTKGGRYADYKLIALFDKRIFYLEGGGDWRMLKNPTPEQIVPAFCDAIELGGQVFAVDEIRGWTYCWDTPNENPMSMFVIPPPVVDDQQYAWFLAPSADGKRLMIILTVNNIGIANAEVPPDIPYAANGLQLRQYPPVATYVFEQDPISLFVAARAGDFHWRQVNSLGDHSLFLGLNYPIIANLKKRESKAPDGTLVPFMRKNCVYTAYRKYLHNQYPKILRCNLQPDEEEIKELEAQVLSLKKDLEKRHEGKSALDKMLSVQQSPNDKSGLGFNSNNKNKSKSKSNKKKGQDKVKDPAKIVCFKCKVEGHHVRSCPLKKKKHLSEKQQGKQPQGQGQAHARPQVEDRPLPKKNQDIVPQEKKSIKKRKGNTCYLCRVKGHFASSCLSGTLSNPIIVDDDYSLGKDKDGNVFAKFVGTQSGFKKRTIWVAKPIVTNLLGPNLVGDQQAQT